MSQTAYAALDVTSNFSFLEGGSHPEELVAMAKTLGLEAVAIADRNTLAGVVRGHLAAKEAGIRFIVGARLDLTDAPSLLVYPTDRAAYGRLCRLLTLGQRRAEKGSCLLTLEDVNAHAEGQIFIALPPGDLPLTSAEIAPAAPTAEIVPFPGKTAQPHPSPGKGEGGDGQRPAPGGGHATDEPLSDPHPTPPPSRGREQSLPNSKCGRHPGESRDPVATAFVKEPKQELLDCEGEPGDDASLGSTFPSQLRRLKAALKAPLYLAARHLYTGHDRARLEALARLADQTGTPLIASTGTLYHAPERRPLQDVLTCVREKCTIEEAGLKLQANAERHLKSPQEMARLFAGYDDVLRRTKEIAQTCRFSLDELQYEYPDEPVPQGKTPQSHLEELAWEGAAHRFPDGIPAPIRAILEKELALIAALNYAPYFLTVHDIVQFARSRGILCQGRGSAANSAVCYCLAITNVNPTEIDVLFERFISPERNEPPDIDVDFEHERREEVIQYIYARYGRDRAGLAATVISYRARSAIREVGKAMGLSEDTVATLSSTVWGRSNSGLPDAHIRQAGLDPDDPRLARTLALTQELIGFPRHLSQHVGGFVLTRGPLCETVPIGNAAMEDRTFIEWDKDDLDALGLMKVDVLALGMLTCIRKCFALLKTHYGRDLSLATVPREDPATYDMLCRADSIGVFQVESRAQMNMLPRLKPRCFYDLVIEVAIVRPGPIQGDMVHPYLRRRAGEEEIAFPSPAPEHGPEDELHQVLGKTMGVPLFQEQAMRLAMVAAKFSSEEANELRRAMATFRRRGTIGKLEEKMVSRMSARGYPRDFAERCFNQIKGFGEYGFPESHAASFAHLVYVSAWLKCHYPAAFAASLLNAQPMGFYAPAQIVRCAQDHGVETRAPDVNYSAWDCALEPIAAPSPGKGEARGGPRSTPSGPATGGGQSMDENVADPHPGPPPSRGREQVLLSHKGSRHPGESRDPVSLPGTGERPLPAGERVGVRGKQECVRGSESIGSPLPPHPAPCADLSPAGRGDLCPTKPLALRLGLRQIDGFREEDADALTAKRHAALPGTSPSPLRGEGRGEGPIRTGEGQARAREEEANSPSPHPPHPAHRADLSPTGRGDLCPTKPLALRLGLRQIDGFREEDADAMSEARDTPYRDLHDLWQRSGLARSALERLANADALRSLGLDRREGLWALRGLPETKALPLFDHAAACELGAEEKTTLPEMPLPEHVINDYRTLRLSLKAHPMSFFRDALREERIVSCADLRKLRHGAPVAVAGAVLIRQRPGSAVGVIFMTLEDETGIANAVIWPKIFEAHRQQVMAARLVLIRGRIQRHEDIIHVVANRLEDRSDWLSLLLEGGLHANTLLANADEVRKPDPGSWRASDAETGKEYSRPHPRWARSHPRNARIIPKSRDFH